MMYIIIVSLSIFSGNALVKVLLFTNSSGIVTHKTSDVWDDPGESDEKLCDLQSGFNKLYLTGYRNAVLRDFQEAETKGRLKGFQSAFQPQPDVNPAVMLSRLDGLLIACLSKCKNCLTEEQRVEAIQIQKEIKQLQSLYYEPASTLLEKVLKGSTNSETVYEQEDYRLDSDRCCKDTDGSKDSLCDSSMARDGECCTIKEQTGKTQMHLISVLTRTRTLYHNIGWKIPDFL